MIERFNARNAFLKPLAVFILPPVESVCNSNKGFKLENLQPVFMRGSLFMIKDRLVAIVFRVYLF